jgi:cytochrome c-type protein NapB
MKKLILMAAAMTLAGAALAEPIQSLRGVEAVDADSVAPEYKAFIKDRPPVARDYLQQPPLIPHQIESYTIDIHHNKCLSCHSWANYRSSRATKISQTHFESRDGAILANVSARRYFCTQCHVPQVDAAPLVENEFAPLDVLKMN